jgi:Flp pilus assembly pilin Flp
MRGSLFRRFWQDERGLEPVEYIVLVAIALLVTGTVILDLRQEVDAMFMRMIHRFMQ